MKLLVKKLRPEAVLPRFAHPDDSGMDVCACEERVLAPGERAKIPLGLAFQPPPGTEIQLRPRSGLAIKQVYTSYRNRCSSFRTFNNNIWNVRIM